MYQELIDLLDLIMRNKIIQIYTRDSLKNMV